MADGEFPPPLGPKFYQSNFLEWDTVLILVTLNSLALTIAWIFDEISKIATFSIYSIFFYEVTRIK